jgi:hypothetical protein
MSSLKELKKILKDLAVQITASKAACKKYQKEHRGHDGGHYAEINGKRCEYRHLHIAYCLIRGRNYACIEKPREGNEPDMAYVNKIREQYENVYTDSK